MSKPPECEHEKAFLPSHGRRIGRRLNSYKRQLVDEWLPQLRVDPAHLFTDKKSLQLEIGFGAGEHLAALAAAYPDTGFIGCEPYLNGIANLLVRMKELKVDNIRIWPDDARHLLRDLPDHCLDSVYILFPDPWPKPRHHKRRIVSTELLDMLARLQPSGARLLLATDHEHYAAWMLERILAHPSYEWTAQCRDDWSNPPKDWSETKYQRKTSLQGRPPVFIECRKRG